MQELVQIDFTLNGKPVKDTAPADKNLLWYLREKLNLTGPKNGCSKGHCGACTVLMNNKADRSCIVPLKSERLKNAVIETVEGLAGPKGELHPIQQAFVDCGAVQCGFCTPGMIMSTRALLIENPEPTEEEIRKHFTVNRNICRCTGYVKIIEAVKDAAQRLKGEKSPYADSPEDMSLRRSEARGKVTGTLKYGDDYRLEGMLHGRILWAAHPHAVLKAIDISGAEKSADVNTIITYKDVKGTNRIGLVERDQPAIVAVEERVRFIGDPIAAVFAETEDAASAALLKIKADYDILQVVSTIEDAQKANTPLVHEKKKNNLFHHARIERGNVEEAFSKCYKIVEGDYETSRIEHAFMEPESGVGKPDGKGGVIIEVPTQCVFDDRIQLSEAIGLPPEKIRVVQIPMGGCFGAKEEIVLHTFLALGALKTGRPVKMVLSREESLMVHQKRHPAWMYYKIGADKEGNLLALDVSIKTDKGAYASLGIDILENMVVFAGGAYYIPAVRIDGKSWHTNTVMSGAMRGFGSNQVGFALESSLDRLAEELNMDPIEFRIKNALASGLPTVADHVLEPGICGLKETLLAVKAELAKTVLPEPKPGKKIGVGVASGVKNIGFGHNLPESSGAIAEMDTKGKVTLKITHHEYGQGAWMGELAIASEILGLPIEDIKLVTPDTEETPFAGPSTASRQSFLTGNAVVGACRNLLADIKEKGARAFRIEDPGAIDIVGDSLIVRFSDRKIKLEELGDRFTASFRYIPPKTYGLLSPGEKSNYGLTGFKSRPTHWCYSYGTHAAIVEVDEATGDVKVLKVIASHDVGKVINRRAVEGQIEGGVIMGVGYALSEQFAVEKGVNLTNTYLKCGITTADRAPEVISIPVEVPHPEGPLGLKGLAETPSLPTAPAVANAIYNAVGARMNSLPATKEKVLAAIKNKSGELART